MVKDTRWQYPPARPAAATLRAWAAVQAALDAPPTGMTAEQYVAERERMRLEAEAQQSRQGSLPFQPSKAQP